MKTKTDLLNFRLAELLNICLPKTATEKDYRRIEVKGLSGEGDVILTQNEVDSSQQTTKRDKYYVYVVDNCLSGKPKRLYILEGIDKNILRPQVAEYSISSEQISAKARVYTL